MIGKRTKLLTRADVEGWRPWFAWYPVRILDGEGFYRTVWWEWIEKRQRYLRVPDYGPLRPEYRLRDAA